MGYKANQNTLNRKGLHGLDRVVPFAFIGSDFAIKFAEIRALYSSMESLGETSTGATEFGFHEIDMDSEGRGRTDTYETRTV